MLQSLYRRHLSRLDEKSVRAHIRKTRLSEWRAIYRKMPLVRTVEWSSGKQREFDDFWRAALGRKIPNYWHRLYESLNGVYRPDYLPEILFTTVIEPSLNPFHEARALQDKTLAPLLYDHVLPGVRTPRTLLSRTPRGFADGDYSPLTLSSALALFSDLGDAVIKRAVGSSSGRDVRFLTMRSGVDERTGERAADILAAFGNHLIVQERVIPHPALSALYPRAVNALRVITYRRGDYIGVCPVTLRVGAGGGEVDNVHAGGIVVAVDEGGRLFPTGYRLRRGDCRETYTAHPDTGEIFSGRQVPLYGEILRAARVFHARTPGMGVVSWDFTASAEGEVILIEANLVGGGVWFPQIASATPLFGKDTAEMVRGFRKQ